MNKFICFDAWKLWVSFRKKDCFYAKLKNLCPRNFAKTFDSEAVSRSVNYTSLLCIFFASGQSLAEITLLQNLLGIQRISPKCSLNPVDAVSVRWLAPRLYARLFPRTHSNLFWSVRPQTTAIIVDVTPARYAISWLTDEALRKQKKLKQCLRPKLTF